MILLVRGFASLAAGPAQDPRNRDPAAKSAEIFARDAIAPALREAVKVVHHVQQGSFLPDSTRSGRFVKMDKVEVPADTEDGGGPEDSSGTFDGDTSTSDSSSDRDEEAAEDIADSRMLMDLVTPELRPRLLEINDDYRMWRHRESGAQHLQLHDEEKFLCGRLVTDKYRLSPDKPSFECPGCKVCFSNKDLENTSTAFWKQDFQKGCRTSILEPKKNCALVRMSGDLLAMMSDFHLPP